MGSVTEELRIDGYAEALVTIGGLLVGPEGEIIIEQRQDSRIQYYDSTGVLLGTFGRAGEGPGEFSGLRGIGYLADTLWAWDQTLSRMSFVSRERELARSFVLRRPIQATPTEFADFVDLVFPTVRGVRRDGNLVVDFALPAGIELPEPYRNQLVLGVVTPDGRLDAIAAQVRHGGPIAYSVGSGGGTIPYPLRNAAQVAVSRTGGRIAGAVASLGGGEADRLAVTVWDDAGVAWSRSVPFDRVPLPATVVDSALAVVDAFPERFRDAFRDQVQVPPAYPPLRGVIVGLDDSVWLEMMAEGEESQPYLVLSETGDLVGTIAIPAGHRIAAARMDRIWTIERDELDVESIVRYGVSWN